MDAITQTLSSLSDEEKKIHRSSFMHFIKTLGSNSEIVSAKCRDGSEYESVFHTATPFAGKDFRVCVKGVKAKVCIFHFLFISISYQFSKCLFTLLLTFFQFLHYQY
jgi:hypothetical protein